MYPVADPEIFKVATKLILENALLSFDFFGALLYFSKFLMMKKRKNTASAPACITLSLVTAMAAYMAARFLLGVRNVRPGLYWRTKMSFMYSF